MLQKSQIKKVKYLLSINLKTIFYNLKWFGFKKGIKLPVLLHSNCKIEGNGVIVISTELTPLMIKIGFGDVGIFDKKNKTIIRNYGRIEFSGKANIGHGSKLSVDQNGKLNFGFDFQITAESSIVCHHEIKFGNSCLLSWDILCIDDDLHPIWDSENRRINFPKSIIIGNNTWIGARTTILKGVKLNDNTIVGAGSIITSSFEDENIIIGGTPNKILKKDIRWSR